MHSGLRLCLASAATFSGFRIGGLSPRRFAATAAMALSMGLGGLANAQCVPEWAATGRIADTDNAIGSLRQINTPTGPQLVVAGSFTRTSDGSAAGVARYDGVAWHSLTTGLPSGSKVLFGGGDQLYAFVYSACPGTASNCFRLQGDAWEPLPAIPGKPEWADVLDGVPYALARTCDDGSERRDVLTLDGDAWTKVGPSIVSGSFAAVVRYHGEVIIGGWRLKPEGGSTTFSAAAVRNGQWVELWPGPVEGCYGLAVWRDALVFGGGQSTTAPWEGIVRMWDGNVWSDLVPKFNLYASYVGVKTVGDDLFLWAAVPAGGPNALRVLGDNGEAFYEVFAGGPQTSFSSPIQVAPGRVLASIFAGSPIVSSIPHLYAFENLTLSPMSNRSGFQPAGIGEYQHAPIAVERRERSDQLPRVWHFVGSTPVQLGDGLDLDVLDPLCTQEFGGSLFVVGQKFSFPSYTPVGYRWDGTSWIDTPNIPWAVPRLVRAGDALFVLGSAGFPGSVGRWNGTSWTTEDGNPLAGATILAADGVRVLLRPLGTPTSTLAVFDGTTLSTLPELLVASAPVACELFEGEPFVSGTSPPGTYRFHDGAWQQVAPDASDSFLQFRGSLYRNGHQRWTGASWVEDDALPFSGNAVKLGNHTSAGGTFLLAATDPSGIISAGEVASYGSIMKTCNCKADLTGDGVQELDDYFAFFNAWDVAGALADVNFDGAVDLLDFFFFFENWDQGCGF